MSKEEDKQVEDFEQLALRKAKRAKIQELAVNSGAYGSGAYPVHVPRTTTIETLRKEYGSLNAGEETETTVSITGRVMFVRDAGKLMFVTLQEGQGARIQAMLNAKELDIHLQVEDSDLVNGEGVALTPGAASLKCFKRTVDLGDHISVTGRVISSKTGELSVLTTSWVLASKALRPLPVLHKELSDDTRARRRYVDLITRQQARDIVRIRSNVVKSLRKNFDERLFLEIETPMLQTIHGGAAARPFMTHINAFDIDLYLRIAPELFLKRAVIGGIEKVFEINRNFRNEGVDSSHSPEFTMLEAYEAYSDYISMADLTQDLIQKAALDVFGSLEVEVFDSKLKETTRYSFASENWTRLDLYTSLSDAAQKKITPETSLDDLIELANKVGLEKEVLSENKKLLTHGKVVELLWEELVGAHLYNPTFVMDFPLDTSPLTRNHRTKPGVVEKWDLYVRGFELATAYSELVDPVLQRERLTKQSELAADGDDEAMKFDEDFLEALEYGMPPTGGMGMGIDRLLMALTGLGIRETIAFTLVKPQ
ncbi:MAG: lysine--tRNA ligase [Candidatus Ancillula sp.]|jgi:lysyl-tRNA synthetase class 2|nr:lysine--tRNA ligase [Candidatus Ancillula sp.]